MRLGLVLAALLCFATWMSVVHATNGPVASCCLRWSNTLKRVPLERILDYTIQSDGVCPITAIVFLTKLGKRICSDPNSDRAKKAILKVDEEKKEALQEKGQTEEELTSYITPTVSTTAVMFQTTRGVRIYSDPNSEEKAILKVDEEKEKALQEKGQNEDGLTSDITPTVSTTAIAFLTKLGKRICSDPNSDRAKKAILKVDEEKKGALQEKGQTEEGLTSYITPPESTTAVVFQTKPGVRIISDPNSDRAKEAILKVDEEKKEVLQEKAQNEEGLTSDITPTVSTTAIVFLTKLGKRICSDPNSDRAKKAILKVDEEKKEALQEQGQNEEELTSYVTPTVSTTAVMFQTTRGVRIYSDPNSEEKAILKVDKEKEKALQEKGQNEDGLTSDITPTVSTTAIAFQTTRGVRIISDPNSDRAKEAILKVDEEKKEVLQEKAQNEEGLTSDITPTVSTTAIVFQTKPGVGISSDPNSDRAEKAILKVDEEKKEALQEKGQNEDGSTSDITPTESTTSKKTPQKKGRRRRRRQKNKSRRWKKAQRKRP